jgi:branched-chain amino acid transport system substrate-binding protein
MNKTAKIVIGAIVLVLVVWAVAATQKKEKTQTKTNGEVYKIGVILPLTSDAAIYGESGNNVLQLAQEEINNAGGINGKKIQLIVEDGKCNGKDGANAAQKLVNVDKVQVILGGFCSSESLAAVPVAEAAKVVVFSSSSSSPKLTGISKYFFRNYPSDSAQGTVLAEVANKKGWKKVAFIVENKDYPLGIYQAFDQRFIQLGGTTTKEEFPPEATDFRTIIAKSKAANADALFLDTQAPAAIERILKQIQEMKWKPQLLVNDVLPGDPPTVERNKNILEGTLSAEFGVDTNNPKFQHLLNTYQKNTGKN